MATTHTFDEQVAIAERQLRRFADGPLLHTIAGVACPSTSGETFENRSPVD